VHVGRNRRPTPETAPTNGPGRADPRFRRRAAGLGWSPANLPDRPSPPPPPRRADRRTIPRSARPGHRLRHLIASPSQGRAAGLRHAFNIQRAFFRGEHSRPAALIEPASSVPRQNSIVYDVDDPQFRSPTPTLDSPDASQPQHTTKRPEEPNDQRREDHHVRTQGWSDTGGVEGSRVSGGREHPVHSGLKVLRRGLAGKLHQKRLDASHARQVRAGRSR